MGVTKKAIYPKSASQIWNENVKKCEECKKKLEKNSQNTHKKTLKEYYSKNI